MQIAYNSEQLALYASAIRLHTGGVLTDTNHNDESFLARILNRLISTQTLYAAILQLNNTSPSHI